MQEKDIIKKLKKLKEVKPDQDWVLSARKEILGVDSKAENKVKWIEVIRFFKARKLAYATLTALFVLIGVFGFAQRSLPGDRLYTVKRTTEQLQNFIKTEEPMSLNLKLADRRLKELNTVVEKSYSQNIDPAVEEFQGSVSRVSDSVDIKEMDNVEEVERRLAEMQEKVKELETLGIVVNKEDLNNLKSNLENERICREAKELITLQKERSLTSQKEQILEEAKESLIEGECRESKEMMLVDFEKAGENQIEIAEEENNNEEND